MLVIILFKSNNCIWLQKMASPFKWFVSFNVAYRYCSGSCSSGLYEILYLAICKSIVQYYFTPFLGQQSFKVTEPCKFVQSFMIVKGNIWCAVEYLINSHLISHKLLLLVFNFFLTNFNWIQIFRFYWFL